MPPHTCSKCARVNPPEAVYCYYDGIALNGHRGAAAGPISIGAQPFSAPFTLPGGKVCQNFDQLALGCQTNWSAALDVLKQGYLEKFLAGQGRADLAQAAREAARFPDKDRGLDQFLAKLPSQAVQPPQLRVEPTELNLGQLKIGDNRTVQLKLENQGMRLIYGSVTVENAPWLTLGTGAGTQQKLFQFGSEMTIPVNVNGKRLRSSNKPLEAKLTIESNAGDNITVIVRAEVPVRAFPSGVLAGARSPRQVAEKAKANPKDAAPLFESGAVANWYKDNGWVYPVKGQSASGLGAVQQFFEALGLTPPPKVDVNLRAVNFTGNPGDNNLRETLEVKSQEKRPVYAHAVSDQPWLEVGRARLNGRVATIPLAVSSVPNRPGEVLKAKLTVTSNGNQRFVIPVTLTIGGNFVFLGPAPAGKGMAAAPVVAVRAPIKHKSKISLLPLLLLGVALLCILGWDIWSLFGGVGPIAIGPGEDDKTPEIEKVEELKPYDNENRVALAFTEETQRFGLSVLRLKDPRYPEKPKLLTRSERGNTNNTIIRIEGHPYVFGRESAGVGIHWARYNGSDELNAFLKKNVYGRHADNWKTPARNSQLKEVRSKDGRGSYSIMDYDIERIRVLQLVEIKVGEGTRLFDTVLVKYVVWNRDQKEHTVGVRVMLDTYIGANDGVPFFVPPTDDAKDHMVDTMEEFSKEKIPQFVRAMENSDFEDKNATVAELGLRLKGFEVPNKMVICRWPQEFGGSEARWDWPYEPMNKDVDKGREKDSCIVLYWSALQMNPKEQRQMGFTYGLGRISGDAGEITEGVTGKGRIKLLTGPAKKAKPFTVTAYMKGADGQNVTLKLPSGLSLVDKSKASQPVKTEAGKDYAQVSWRVQGQQPGEYILEAVLDDNGNAKAKAQLVEGSIFD